MGPAHPGGGICPYARLMKPPKLLTAAVMAERLSVSVETVYRMCKSGQWPHSRIGRLYRFTEEHYQTIIAEPDPPSVRLRSQRDNIARMLRGTP